MTSPSDTHAVPDIATTRMNAARRLVRALALLLVAVTFLLVIAGGQVTSTDSGDAVPTWPLPLTLPTLEGGAFFELGHRQVAAFSGLVTVALCVAIACYRRRLAIPSGVLKGSICAVFLVVLQAVLGGVRVLVGESEGTPETTTVAAIGIGHTILGQTFFWVTAALAYFLIRKPRPESGATAARALEDTSAHRSMATVTWVVVGALYLQLFLGSLVRLLRPGPKPIPLLLHILGAVVVTGALVELIFRTYRARERFAHLLRPVMAAKSLLGIQIILGIVSYFAVAGAPNPASPEITWRTIVPTFHVATGALLLATAVIAALIQREFVGASAEAAESAASVDG